MAVYGKLSKNNSTHLVSEYAPAKRKALFKLIQEATDGHIAEVIQKSWDWLFLNNPFRPKKASNILVIESNFNIVGLYCNIFVDLKTGDKIEKARWGCNFIIHPQHRYKGKGTKIFRQSKEIPYYPYLGFPNKRVLLFGLREGAQKIANIYSYFCILNVRSLLQHKFKNRFIAYLGGISWNLISKVCFTNRSSHKDISIEEITYFDEKFNKFWEEISRDYPVIVVRNQRYLNWRFIEGPFKYHIFTATKDNHILGYIVLRQAERDGLKRGYIVDILAKAGDRKTLNALISKAISFFKENKCDIAECPLLTSQIAYYKILKKYGFLIRLWRAYFDGYSKDEEEVSLIKNPDNWFVTASDPDLEIWV